MRVDLERMQLMSVKRPFLTSAHLYSFANLLNAATAFIASFLNAYVLGAHGRGETANSLQWAYVLWPIITIGLDKYLARHVHLSRKQLASLLRAPVLIASILSISLIIAKADIFLMSVPLIALGGSYMALLKVWSMKNDKTRYFVFTTLLYAIANISFSLIFYINHEVRPQVWLVPYLLPGLVCVVETIFTIRVKFALELEHVKNSFRLILGGISSALILRLDRLVLGAIRSPENLGKYVVVATIFEAMLWPIFAQAQIVATQSNSTESMKIVTIKRFTMWLILTALTSGVIYALLPVLGSSYVSARELIFPLALSTGPLALTQFQWAYLLKSNDWKSSGNPAVIGAIFAGLIYPTLIFEFGSLGAAWGSVLCYSVFSISGSLYLRNSDIRIKSGKA